MPLLYLPPETLVQIFTYVGPLFFQKDITRLTVSKRWFEFARSTCYQHVTFSPERLRAFVSSKSVERPDIFRDNVQALALNFGIHRGPLNAVSSWEPMGNDLYSTLARETAEARSSSIRFKNLDADLGQIGIILQQAPKLRFLRIEAYGSPTRSQPDGPAIIYHSTMKTVLSVEHLTSLVMDLPGRILSLKEDRERTCHICPMIGAILHRLLHLRLRMRRICPDALRSRDPTEDLRLNRVVINMDCGKHVPGQTETSLGCSTYYGPGIGKGMFQKLKADLGLLSGIFRSREKMTEASLAYARLFYLGSSKEDESFDFDEAATRGAVERLGTSPPKPFCPFLLLIWPHYPFEAGEPYFFMYNGSLMPEPTWASSKTGPEPQYMKEIREQYGITGTTKGTWAEITATYSMMTRLDDQF
ncbi:hypothetical protein FACUT_4654 [Fusarium acutatum]|uniref:F-box domain-containing protein n=1 Tax=Fusarium acutatum TaxID=78861 RepID=A0A8H4NNU6_9HYPO|nr:hypothetical protein FACUT_4654 [Fusarium acutatum]